MDEALICPVCHVVVRSIDFFCYNCGKNLQAAPASISLSTQLSLYIGSILLPPMGIWWSIKYLKSQDQKTRNVGIALIAITVIILIIVTRYTISMYNTAIKQVDQIQNLQEF